MMTFFGQFPLDELGRPLNLGMVDSVEWDRLNRVYRCHCTLHGAFFVPVEISDKKCLKCEKCEPAAKVSHAESVTEWMGNPS